MKTLNRHKKTVHEMKPKHQGLESKSINCDECDYRTSKENMMGLHKKAVHKKKTYNCQSCEFRTLDERLLTKHLSTVHLECNLCDFRTTLPQVLHTHQKMHGLNFRKRKSTTD